MSILSGSVRRLSSGLCPVLAMGVLLLWPAALWAYIHHASKVRFVEHSPQAFEAARREGKPVFLLVSAVWCYWCKFFERETLETAEVSAYLNRHYVSIFVDHDRRMDLARRYVRGLPMVVLFDPDGRVRQSFAGALKREDFLSVLRRVEAEARDPAKGPPGPPGERVVTPAPVPVTPETERELRERLLLVLNEQLDAVHGGFGTGDKHPHPRLLAYLLERHRATGDARFLAMVEKSLDGILRGIYDPVDGGFFRYAEGREWRQPHYEKLVHLNASLAAVFDRTHQLTRHPRYQGAARATVDYLLRTLYDPRGGGFYSSQTADPAYYQLSPPERRATPKPPINRDKVTAWNAEAALAFLQLSESSGRRDLAEVASRTLEFLRRSALTDKGVFHFYQIRAGRGHLRGQLEANAWAALAFVEGARVLRADAYRQAAERVLAYAIADLFDRGAGAFVEGRNPDERAATGPIQFPLDANGVMAEALLRAHGLTGRAEYREVATRVLAALGGAARALVSEEEDAGAVARLEGSVFYLRAYAELTAKP